MTKVQRIEEAIEGATRFSDPVAIWRETLATDQVSTQQFRLLAAAIDEVSDDIVESLLATRGQPLEERFNAAQPDYIAPEEVRTAWLLALAAVESHGVDDRDE